MKDIKNCTSSSFYDWFYIRAISNNKFTKEVKMLKDPVYTNVCGKIMSDIVQKNNTIGRVRKPIKEDLSYVDPFGAKARHGNKPLLIIIATISLLLMQILLGKAGNLVADVIPHQQFDPYHAFAGISIHHFVQLMIALLVIVSLSKLLKINFHFQIGDAKRGLKFLAIFAGAYLVISTTVHILMYVNNKLPTYDFPLDGRNIMGTLGFQLFLSGLSEEVVYRAIPITLLTYAFSRSVQVKGSLTLEVILASILFSLAHTNWSLQPLVFHADLFQMIYAFALGIIQGIAYQRSKSILYPILMHSISNVLMVGTGYLFTIF
jgi:membrane protease YdiL (CAAX protease family)